MKLRAIGCLFVVVCVAVAVAGCGSHSSGSPVAGSSPTAVAASASSSSGSVPMAKSQIACGFNFCLAVKNDGSLWAWGGNGAGQLGLGDSASRAVPTRVTGWQQ